jgi:hypothetical protein
MYAFLILAFPLGFLFLTLVAYPAEEKIATRRAFIRGLVSSIAVWLLALLLGAILPPFWGSPLLALNEWMGRLLPWALGPALAYAVFYHYGVHLAPGEAQRRLTAFYAGCLAPLGLTETVKVWGNPGAYPIFIIPLFFAVITLAFPRLVLGFFEAWGARKLGLVLLALFAGLAGGFVLPLFLAQLWPLALLLAALLAAGAWFYAAPELFRRPPPPLRMDGADD